MKKKLLFAVLLCMVFVYGCSGGGSGNSSTSSGVNTSLRVPAENIVFAADTQAANDTAKIYMAADGSIDNSTKILAQNVVVDNTSNALKSDNLQSVLDDEMAIDLSKHLRGTTWTITNKTIDPFFSGTTGQITFKADGTFTIDSGRFASAGIVHAQENSLCYKPLNRISYELLSNSVMYVSWTGQSPVDASTHAQDAAITIIARDKNSMVMLGDGGCGMQGVQKVSVLTKTSAPQRANFRIEKKPNSVSTLLVSNKQ